MMAVVYVCIVETIWAYMRWSFFWLIELFQIDLDYFGRKKKCVCNKYNKELYYDRLSRSDFDDVDSIPYELQINN